MPVSQRSTSSGVIGTTEGEPVLDDPGENGFLLDERPNPPRHPAARACILGGNRPMREPPRWLIDPPKRGP